MKVEIIEPGAGKVGHEVCVRIVTKPMWRRPMVLVMSPDGYWWQQEPARLNLRFQWQVKAKIGFPDTHGGGAYGIIAIAGARPMKEEKSLKLPLHHWRSSLVTVERE